MCGWLCGMKTKRSRDIVRSSITPTPRRLPHRGLSVRILQVLADFRRDD
jgi:hypothetical protein